MAETRQRVRALLQPWFDPKPGPRGFVLGRLVCIWSGLSLYHTFELVALIRRDGSATRISGITTLMQAALALVLVPAIAAIWAAVGMVKGELYAMGAVPILMVSILTLVLAAWLLRRNNNEHNEIVGLLRKEFEPQESPEPLTFARPTGEPRRMAMDVSGARSIENVTIEELTAALDAMHEGRESHVILSRSETEFVQSAASAFGYSIERRNIGDDWPRNARRIGAGSNATFQIEEVKQLFCAYLYGARKFPELEWQ
ncbi:hypothetical protein K3179_06390 [Qipengyuania sp. GH38]|uniref:hypothetical protein n=1 Tax=Qipengyuania intermedia TaxID=2867244 RepID=UPI001C88771A|nr:hypothetical protein [Qipengyuania intermedia]MBX7514177.1 hypothetical protein [Qipengyuania intermedia]